MNEEVQLAVQAEARLNDLERRGRMMRQANAAIRLNAAGGQSAQADALVLIGYTRPQALALVKPDFRGLAGFDEEALRRNAAEVARIRGWLAHQDELSREV